MVHREVQIKKVAIFTILYYIVDMPWKLLDLPKLHTRKQHVTPSPKKL